MPDRAWYWLSFVSHATPEDAAKKHLGCAIVGPCASSEEALELALRHDCSPPSAECEATELPPNTRIDLADTFRLLDRDELDEVFGSADVRKLLAMFECKPPSPCKRGVGCAIHARNEVEHLRSFKQATLDLLAAHPEAREWLPGWARPRAEP